MAKRIVNKAGVQKTTIVFSGSGNTGLTSSVTISVAASTFRTLDSTKIVVVSKTAGANVFLNSNPIYVDGVAFSFTVGSSTPSVDFDYQLISVGVL